MDAERNVEVCWSFPIQCMFKKGQTCNSPMSLFYDRLKLNTFVYIVWYLANSVHLLLYRTSLFFYSTANHSAPESRGRNWTDSPGKMDPLSWKEQGILPHHLSDYNDTTYVTCRDVSDLIRGRRRFIVRERDRRDAGRRYGPLWWPLCALPGIRFGKI